MWPFSLFSRPKGLAESAAPVFFTNTLSGKKDLFVPLKAGMVSMYSCGPTVYGKQHIGNLKAPLFADLVARTLAASGFHLRRVINITDVGHMVGDADHGEDKMAKGAREANASPKEVADRYTTMFLTDLNLMNIETENVLFPRATEHIPAQIEMIKVLEKKGFTYRAQDGIYFDTSKFPNYGKLGGADKAELLPGARVEKVAGKKSGRDFVLWRDAGPHDLQIWDSPWGRGNPGWHIECSAMSKVLLGNELDIHTGGIDHIPVHHNNEIAQSESANGRPFVRYWMHEAFVNVEDEKISKSLRNDVYLSDITERGLHPLSLRYFFLQAHYRTPLSFSWEAIAAANEALRRLWRLAMEIKKEADGQEDSEIRLRFVSLMRDDLSTPQALAALWDALKTDELSPEQKWALLETAEPYLGLSLTDPPIAMPTETEDLPEHIQALVYERDLARSSKDWQKADELRYQLQERGYRVDDGPSGTLLTKDAE